MSTVKAIVEPELRDAELNEWRGADATVWLYHATCNRLRANRGSVCRENASLSIGSVENEQGEPTTRVLDVSAGFDLKCSSVVLVRGSAADVDLSFDNFFSGSR